MEPSEMATWAPAALFYSERLIYLPLGIFATALGTVLLPLFSGQAARGDHAALRDSVQPRLRTRLLISFFEDGVTPAMRFDTDLLRPIIALVEELCEKRYGDAAQADVSMRVIADHARATTFLVSDGVLPSNEGRGYVLRRILRRGLRHGRERRRGHRRSVAGRRLGMRGEARVTSATVRHGEG